MGLRHHLAGFHKLQVASQGRLYLKIFTINSTEEKVMLSLHVYLSFLFYSLLTQVLGSQLILGTLLICDSVLLSVKWGLLLE